MQVLRQLPKFYDPKIIVGGVDMDDAGVYAINDDTAIVQSVDILTPIADDPTIFGQIAAANALSDIYAMAAKPITALTILSYPPKKIGVDTVVEILKGVSEKVKEAGACILGGHTLRNQEIKCGLAVCGIAKPSEIITNGNARPGDKIVLTKPLGTGVISTALKAGCAGSSVVNEMNRVMCQLNRYAAEAMLETGVSSATDVTGFGLLGHAMEMAECSGVSLYINAEQVPIIKGALEFARQGLFPAGSIKNFEFVRDRVDFAQGISEEVQLLLCDAQTSGGLLISVSENRVSTLLEILKKRGIRSVSVIGEVRDAGARRIYVR